MVTDTDRIVRALENIAAAIEKNTAALEKQSGGDKGIPVDEVARAILSRVNVAYPKLE